MGLDWCLQFIMGKMMNREFCEVDEVTSCWLPRHSVRPDGYCGVKVVPLPGARSRNILLHVISCAAAMGEDLEANVTVSHLCGVRRCFNPEHLIAESQAENNSRNGCPGLRCICSHGVNLSSGVCAHNPPCLMVKKLRCPYDMDGIAPPISHLESGRREIRRLRGEIPVMQDGVSYVSFSGKFLGSKGNSVGWKRPVSSSGSWSAGTCRV